MTILEMLILQGLYFQSYIISELISGFEIKLWKHICKNSFFFWECTCHYIPNLNKAYAKRGKVELVVC